MTITYKDVLITSNEGEDDKDTVVVWNDDGTIFDTYNTLEEAKRGVDEQ